MGVTRGCIPAGGIPEELGNLGALEQMYFNHNHLSGESLSGDISRVYIRSSTNIHATEPRCGGCHIGMNI